MPTVESNDIWYCINKNCIASKESAHRWYQATQSNSSEIDYYRSLLNAIDEEAKRVLSGGWISRRSLSVRKATDKIWSPNHVGPCPNCGGTEFVTLLFGGWGDPTNALYCKRCRQYWLSLKCPRCGARTDINQTGLPLDKWCFLATATYGSPHVYEVELLRQYRDKYLCSTALGRLAIRLYEFVSPPLARWVAQRPFAREFTRRIIISPFARIIQHEIDGN